MASRLPVALIAQTFSLGTTAVTVSDAIGAGRTVNISPSGTRFFRILAAANGDSTASTATTEANAVEFLDHLEQRFAIWTFTVTSDLSGRSKIRYDGTGSASLTVTGALARLLGFQAGVYSFTAGSSHESTYQMSAGFWALNQANSHGWQRGKPVGAWAKMPTGRRFGWQLGVRSEVLWTFETIGHPADSVEQVGLAAWGSPLRPDAKSRYKTPPSSPAAVDGPWSYWDFVDTAMGVDLGVMQFPPTGSTYDRCHLDISTWEAVNNARTTAPNWDAAYDIENIALSYVDTLSF